MPSYPPSSRFEFDQSLTLYADFVDATFPGASVFVGGQESEAFAFEAGYLDPVTLQPSALLLSQTYADEYRLEVSPDGLRTGLKARDALSGFVDGQYRRLFLRSQPTNTDVDERTGEMAVGGIPFYVAATWWASAIAAQICQDFGLTCKWEAPDYVYQEDFSAVGPAMQQLLKLLEPFRAIPAFQADVFTEGTTITIRTRTGAFTPTPNCTLSVYDARISQLVIRRRPGIHYGKVTLLGIYGQYQDGGVLPNPAVFDYEVEDPPLITLDEFQRPTAQVLRTTTYRAPLNLVVKEVEQKLVNQELAEETTTTNVYEELVFRGGVPNHPKLLHQVKSTKSQVKYPNGSTQFTESSREDTTYAYSGQGYQEAVTTTKKKLNARLGIMDVQEIQVKTLRRTSDLEAEQATTTYKPDPKTGALIIQQTQTQRSAGFMPGGPKPPQPATAGSGDPNAGKEQIKIEHWISTTDPLGQDVTYSNIHMTMADLSRIRDQFIWFNQRWTWELEFDCAAMPWIKKGVVVQLTGLEDAGGTPIPLQPALVDECRITYDGGQETSSFTAHVLARYWAAG